MQKQERYDAWSYSRPMTEALEASWVRWPHEEEQKYAAVTAEKTLRLDSNKAGGGKMRMLPLSRQLRDEPSPHIGPQGRTWCIFERNFPKAWHLNVGFHGDISRHFGVIENL
ncbi:hypothetical protein TcasGA2_TC000952 [Tribolium castaneum]|uniref:Uncharacterized protein n=1 Tax=Tribolium castaneum TaxID=7070 RepID=D6W983_TRICA|nr:hypothetical protein TcasGA2_TC000952 [Tribolium castaneum]